MNKDFKTTIIDVEVSGRKNPLKIVREKLNVKHEKFFRISSDKEIDHLSRDSLINKLVRIHEVQDKELPTDVLKDRLKQFQRKRHLQLWHDGSCIANHSHILFMVNALYDKAIYLSNTEYC